MIIIQNATNTIRLKPVLVVSLVLAVIALLATPLGPLGVFWRPSGDIPVTSATGIQMILFFVLNIAEALAFGLGFSFLVFGYPFVRAISPASARLTRAAHFAISWLLINWWMHDSLHLHVGMELNGLLVMEYGFHVTLMIAGVILAAFFLSLLHQGNAVSQIK